MTLPPIDAPFALLYRGERVEVLTGDVSTVDTVADIPLGPPERRGPHVLAAVPYRQIAERGFACVDDSTPLKTLTIRGYAELPRDDVLRALPTAPAVLRDGAGFDLSDEDYADIVDTVLREEIGRGEGANFVIYRTFTATVDGEPVRAALAAYRRLLLAERGAYWTFLVHLGDRTLVGATPERHVSVEDGLVMMNPISGTYRHPRSGPDKHGLLGFLGDPKEIDELHMVLDEELKMMATVADLGGQVVGPYLKEMAHLTHTEYLLAGRSSLDVRDVLRETMFAPTVTGSPIENACRVIARHERRGRGYYAGVLALLGYDDAGRQTLDTPILIRTADVDRDGRLRVPVGATLVRHSTADGEVAETHAKAAGVLSALGIGPATSTVDRPAHRADDPEILAALSRRNERLSRFWLRQRTPGALPMAPELAGRSVLVVDGEDTFTGMLAHLLRALGLRVTVRPYAAIGNLTGFDVVVPGPGPGDPSDLSDPRMATLHGLVRRMLAQRRPTLAICLGHQVLASVLGLRLHQRDVPYQGLAREVDLFGTPYRVGFYSTFVALADDDTVLTPYGRIELARDGADGTVHALRGAGFAGVQFHPESVLTERGEAVLRDLLGPLLGVQRPDEARLPA